jgi:D-3-phosphoglycerate dehydrogenase / 2-oxoglutarate reductase
MTDSALTARTDLAAPIVLFIDHGFDSRPFAEELAPELSCRPHVDAHERPAVAALVTGAVPIGDAEVNQYSNLRMVLTCSTGTDHLDLDVLRRRGLIVCNTPTYCSEEVADHALACVLAGWRGLWQLDRAVRAGAWETGTVLRRFDSQRLGIIGLGRIGRALARKAAALAIDVVAHDPFVSAAVDGVELLPLEELLATSDAVSLHAPGPPAGAAGVRPILGAAELVRMKPGAVLVNLARASLVDLDAVLSALQRGHLRAVAYDVWPEEPPLAGDVRLDTPGLLVTPHVGWSSPEAERACLAEAVAALRSALIGGQEPDGRVA